MYVHCDGSAWDLFPIAEMLSCCVLHDYVSMIQ